MDNAFNRTLGYVLYTSMIVFVVLFWKIYDKRKMRDLGLSNAFRLIKSF